MRSLYVGSKLSKTNRLLYHKMYLSSIMVTTKQKPAVDTQV